MLWANLTLKYTLRLSSLVRLKRHGNMALILANQRAIYDGKDASRCIFGSLIWTAAYGHRIHCCLSTERLSSKPNHGHPIYVYHSPAGGSAAFRHTPPPPGTPW